MRISDWSSDVCSSDLQVAVVAGLHELHDDPLALDEAVGMAGGRGDLQAHVLVEVALAVGLEQRDHLAVRPDPHLDVVLAGLDAVDRGDIAAHLFDLPGFRSEEHTSELQSLMRISYAVFCLKT